MFFYRAKENVFIVGVLILGIVTYFVASFSPPQRFHHSSRALGPLNRKAFSLDAWQDVLKGLFSLDQDDKNKKTVQNPRTTIGGADECLTGTVVRLAARKYSNSSKWSSPEYTTRKDEFSCIRVAKEGVSGDYNHYRTLALKSTGDRAISILTLDVMKSIQGYYRNYNAKNGDLGENILVEGVQFDFFRLGQQYVFESTSDNPSEDTAKERVVVEITEPMEPCANLCKLPYINDQLIPPKDRIERCKNVIEFLGQVDGFRGWYAKVVEPGVIRTGARASIIETDNSKVCYES